MDERLEKALEFSNYTVTLNNQIRLLSEKFAENNIYYYGGGQFTATEQRMTFCDMLVNRGLESVTLIDDNGTPIDITDISQFLQEIMDLYFSSTNEFRTEYDKLRKNRSVKGITEL